MEVLRKRAILSASKSLLIKGRLGYAQSSTSRANLSRTCFSSATYYYRIEGLSSDEGNIRRGHEDHHHHDHKNVENMSGVTGLAADTAVRGTLGSTKIAENLSATWQRRRMDKAWDSAKNRTQNVQDTLFAAADENVVDTTEYRTIEDLKNSFRGQWSCLIQET
ncbi:hypothetical protein TIFTF001_023626 [Ficus carica]|uniref:Uncharacterized protein n=1 Tax=Ficus carica TaxID=3494 RepID=A0AA88DFF4_FICCA|nr:hypothetical protein TIFTF001_023626 [Ficus carica]